MKRLILIICLLAITEQAWAATYYVDASKANDLGTGTSWATAKKTLIGAFAIVGLAPQDQIWIKNGVYTSTAEYHVPDQVQIYGSFVGTETLLSQRPAITPTTLVSWQADTTGTNHTVFDGTGLVSTTLGSIFSYALDQTYTVLDGCEIRKGSAIDFTMSTAAPYYGNVWKNILIPGGGIHIQGPMQYLINILMVASGSNLPNLDYSQAGGAISQLTMIGDTSVADVGYVFLFDASNVACDNITLKNFLIGNTVSLIQMGESGSVTVSGLTVSNILSTATSSTIGLLIDNVNSFGVISNAKISSIVNPSNRPLMNMNGTGTALPARNINYYTNFYNTDFSDMGSSGKNLFSLVGTNQTVSFINSTIDSSAINNATTTLNSPIGYYKYRSGTSRRGFGF